MRARRSSSGFTLVELLVVIAIIGILAGLIAAGLPGVLRRAKIASTKNTFNQLRTTLIAYYTDNNTLPPAYGYLSPLFATDEQFANPNDRPVDIVNSGLSEDIVFFLRPWMSAFREHGNEDLYDNWSRGRSYDTDGDADISRLEFAPIGEFISASQSYRFPFTLLFRPGQTNDNATEIDLANQLASQGPRPFIYIPVNSRQARVFRNIMYAMAARQGAAFESNPRPFNLDATAITEIEDQLSFPPPSYDSFVLMSVGPNAASGGTSGLLVDWDRMGLDNFTPEYAQVNQYHLLALASYFLATRDSEDGGKGNAELDFDYEARVNRGAGENFDNDLPGAFPRGAGPMIYLGGA